MRKHLFTVIIIFVFLVGLSVLLYPTVADYINSRTQSRVVSSYHDAILKIDDSRLVEIFEAAKEFNAALAHRADRFMPTEELIAEYDTLLNPVGNGMMGSLEIPAIYVNLPIYHGYNPAVLQVGVGHYTGSSLPVGGLGTHSVLTGHRGLPSSTLLTNLDRLVVGDVFTLHIMNVDLLYQVDRILGHVEPENVTELGIEADKDYCTLVTCTPYGINSHRLLVRGTRIENAAAIVRGPIVPNEARKLPYVQVSMTVLVPLAIVLIIYRFIRFWLRQKKGEKK